MLVLWMKFLYKQLGKNYRSRPGSSLSCIACHGLQKGPWAGQIDLLWRWLCLPGLTILRNGFLIKKWTSKSFAFPMKMLMKTLSPAQAPFGLHLVRAPDHVQRHSKVISHICSLLACFCNPVRLISFLIVCFCCQLSSLSLCSKIYIAHALLKRFTPNTVHHERFHAFLFCCYCCCCCCCWEAGSLIRFDT